MAVHCAPADPSDARIAALIEAHRAASRAHYAPEDCHSLDADTLIETRTEMHAAYDGATVLAIGGLKDLGRGKVELKSMFTAEAARGRGVAAALLAHLIAVARAAGQSEILLEAGRSDAYAAPARALYARAGFAECPPFGDYVAAPASIFMARAL